MIYIVLNAVSLLTGWEESAVWSWLKYLYPINAIPNQKDNSQDQWWKCMTKMLFLYLFFFLIERGTLRCTHDIWKIHTREKKLACFSYLFLHVFYQSTLSRYWKIMYVIIPIIRAMRHGCWEYFVMQSIHIWINLIDDESYILYSISWRRISLYMLNMIS